MPYDAGFLPGGRFSRGGAGPCRRLLEADGVVGGLRPGRYRLIVASGGGPVATPFTVAAGRSEELTVRLQE